MYISISIVEQLMNYSIFVGVMVLTAVTVKRTIFWDVTPCDPVKFTDISEELDKAGLPLTVRSPVCCLFTDMVSNSGYTGSNDCVTVNELDGMWKEAVVA
jgi:hypothetical protein